MEWNVNIYVGNLSANSTQQQLRELFSRFGTVGKISLDDRTRGGKSFSFCFVEMPQDHEALSAIQALNGRTVAGNALTIKASGVGV